MITGAGAKSMSATHAAIASGVRFHLAPGLECSHSSETDSKSYWRADLKRGHATTQLWMRRMPSCMSSSAIAKLNRA